MEEDDGGPGGEETQATEAIEHALTHEQLMKAEILEYRTRLTQVCRFEFE